MTTEAIINEAYIAEVDLGIKAHAFSAFEKRERMFRQVAGVFFDGVIRNAQYWQKQEGIRHADFIGIMGYQKPEVVQQDWRRWIGRFKEDFFNNLYLYTKVLSAETLGRLIKIAMQVPEEFSLPADLWAQIVLFDFLPAYAFNKGNKIMNVKIICCTCEFNHPYTFLVRCHISAHCRSSLSLSFPSSSKCIISFRILTSCGTL